ncbi:hypothetical protein HNQ08_000375 [Deinococcus humi]|uniref:Uncharacterized protein n=1 Tax=Deinococcus humi TaxID=662880 RepID=A0A7W8NBN7_9DEIO|nr:hypothetical protein [Deinococcus humi]GGO19390.1 hypothetical protein GCM10008949_03700 [Deinococcus humi]
MSECAHCWHTVTVLLTMPPQHEQVCCFCGEKRRQRDIGQQPMGHGPFAPALTLPSPRTAMARDLGIDVAVAKRAGVGLGMLDPEESHE